MLDLTTLLSALDADAPCGEDLEYDAQFVAMEKAAQGTPERQFGNTLIAAEAADWRTVHSAALELFARTRDLRVAVYLTRAGLNLEGVSGFADGLALLEGLLAQYWEPVYPQLDPDDDNDPTLRINILLGLCDAETTLQELRCAPLVTSRALGRFGLREVQIAAGVLAASSNDEETAPSLDMINGAFQDAPLAALQETSAALHNAFTTVANIENIVTERVGVIQAPNLSALSALLKEMRHVLNEQLQLRGADVADAVEEDSVSAAQAAPAATNVLAGTQRVITGEITSREEVARALDKICEYYAKYEPSSPVPFMLKRTKKLVRMDFMQILHDLAPSGTSEADTIFGIVPEEEE